MKKLFEFLISVHPETKSGHSIVSDYMNNLMELVKQNYHGTSKRRFISKLENISCVFLPLKGVLKRAPLKGVLKKVPFTGVRIRQVNV